LVPDPVIQLAGQGCVLTDKHEIWCWGLNAFGQLGIGTADENPHPLPTKALPLCPAEE
jgi:hypothetical protein